MRMIDAFLEGFNDGLAKVALAVKAANIMAKGPKLMASFSRKAGARAASQAINPVMMKPVAPPAMGAKFLARYRAGVTKSTGLSPNSLSKKMGLIAPKPKIS